MHKLFLLQCYSLDTTISKGVKLDTNTTDSTGMLFNIFKETYNKTVSKSVIPSNT